MNRIASIFAVTVAMVVVTNSKAQTLFTYGNKQVSKAEFLRAFNKNNVEASPGSQAFRDYLDLYTRFKIKVRAALDARLDTLPNQKAELLNFRQQVASSYMNDEASTNVLIEEAITRSAKDLLIAHIYIPLDPSSTDQAAAIALINQAYSRSVKGEDFEKLAVEYSKDPSVTSNKGVIGYITCFGLPYDLETLAYSTPTGQVSKPYRSKIGFHIFKNLGERKAAGRMRAAQILLSFPPDVTTTQKQFIAKKADSIYASLLKGADFKEMALRYSGDNLTYQNGGELQEFGTGQYDAEFEKNVFAIKADGEMAAPFESAFGYHIVKRLQRKPVELDKSDKAVWENFRQLVTQSDRMEVSKNALLKKILQQTALKKLPANQKALNLLTESVLASKKHLYAGGLKPATALYSFPKQNIIVSDWVNYLEAIKGTVVAGSGKSNEQLMNQFIETSAVEYYKEHLEEYNKEFAYQLNEFKEGNLLFEIMQRKIWDAAAADSNGLKKYYDAHKNNYWWEASADAWIITASNDSIANETISKLKSSSSIIDYRRLIDESNGSLQGDSGRFELSQLPVVDRTNFTKGLITAPVKNEADNSVTFCYIVAVYNNKEQRAFTDAKGFVINDYQTFLEEEWIKSLKKKYPIKIDELVFKSLAAPAKK